MFFTEPDSFSQFTDLACLHTLKHELEILQNTFPKHHERFQVLNCNLDELLCRFIDGNGKFYDIQATITDMYPMWPPIWYFKCNEESITNAMKILTNSKGQNNYVIMQVALLVRQLCGIHNVPLPKDIDKLKLSSICQMKTDIDDADDLKKLYNAMIIKSEPESESNNVKWDKLHLENRATIGALLIQIAATLDKSNARRQLNEASSRDED